MTEQKPLKELIGELANVITRVSQSQIKEYMNETGLSHSQFMTLMRLYRHEGGYISAMSAHLGTTDAAASQLIERLVNLGLVDRFESETDRRAKKVVLTEKGRAMVEHLLDLRKLMVDEMISNIPPEKQQLIVEAAGTLVEAAQKFEQRFNRDNGLDEADPKEARSKAQK